MRLYFDVKLSTPQKTFIPTALFFAPEDWEEDNDVPSENVVKLEGITCESAPFDKTSGDKSEEFSVRWKGVTMETDKDFDENFTLDELKEMLKNKRLVNMEANLDYDTEVTVITGITIKYMNENDYDIPGELTDVISFDGIDNYD